MNLLELITELNTILGTSAVPTHGPSVGDVKHSRAKIDRHPRGSGLLTLGALRRKGCGTR